MKKYYVVHTHRHGTDIHFFQSLSLHHFLEENLNQIVKQLNIDYEEDRSDEEIELFEVPDQLRSVTLMGQENSNDELIKATYVSVWDGQHIRSSCDFNPSTKTISNIESIDTSGLKLNTCEREFVDLPDGTELEIEEGITIEE